ncbi:hypothetical protein WJX79_005916 [Trebouxia sp. C0005]
MNSRKSLKITRKAHSALLCGSGWYTSHDLLQEMVDKKSKDPFCTIRVARKALSKIRGSQRDSAPGCRREELYFGRKLNTFDCELLHPTQEDGMSCGLENTKNV